MYIMLMVFAYPYIILQLCDLYIHRIRSVERS